jgi:hypothetical protein
MSDLQVHDTDPHKQEPTFEGDTRVYELQAFEQRTHSYCKNSQRMQMRTPAHRCQA